jgi:uncharacterized protein (DUF2062 family)
MCDNLGFPGVYRQGLQPGDRTAGLYRETADWYAAYRRPYPQPFIDPARSRRAAGRTDACFSAPGTPHGVAAGLAAGVAVSLTPFLGLHLLLTLGLAYLTRGDLLAAVLGTLVGNPWTLPLILATDYRLGCLILGLPPQGLHLPGELGPDTLLGEVGRLLWPMAVGSMPLAAAAWAVIYVAAVRAVVVGRERRLRRLERQQ